MAFVLKQTDSYTWPVPVELPADGGRFNKQTFDAQFKRLPQDRIRDIMDKIQAGEIDDDTLCREILIGWSGVQDNKSEEIPFSESSLNVMLNVQMVAAAVVSAWFDSLAKAKRKN
jgi:hypothetical protein